MWVPTTLPRKIVDTSGYEAFPRAAMLPDGRTIMAWQTGDTHLTGQVGRMIITADAGETWGAPINPNPDTTGMGAGNWGVTAIATLGTRIAIMCISSGPYAGWVQVSTDPTTWPARRPISWGTAGWVFPCDMVWLDNGSADGLMLAVAYGADGVMVTASLNAGVTWSRRSTPLPPGAGWSEATITRVGARLLMLARWDPSGGASSPSSLIAALWSDDMGITWTAPATAATAASGLPVCTVMRDGALLATIRDTAGLGVDSWSLIYSEDGGHTWDKLPLSDWWMMYGNIVQLPGGDGLLVGASQVRGSATNSDVWVQTLSLPSSVAIPSSVSDGAARLRIDVPAGFVGRALTITASDERGSRIVRGWRDVEAPPIAVVLDYEAPLEMPVRYAVLIDGVEIAAIVLTLPSELPLLTDPIYGKHMPVMIQSWPEATYERAGQTLRIAGSSTPVVIDGEEYAPETTLTVIHPRGGDTADQLEQLLDGTSVLRVRPACADLPAAWVSVRARTRRRFSDAPHSAAVDVLVCQHIDQPWPDRRAVGNTLGDLHAAYPGSLGDLRAAFPGVLADIAFEDLTP